MHIILSQTRIRTGVSTTMGKVHGHFGALGSFSRPTQPRILYVPYVSDLSTHHSGYLVCRYQRGLMCLIEGASVYRHWNPTCYHLQACKPEPSCGPCD